MKVVPLLNTALSRPLPGQSEPPPLDYRATLVAAVLHTDPTRGLTLAAQRERCKLADAIETAKGEAVALEDAQHALLVECLDAFPFAVADAALVAMGDAVRDAPAPNPDNQMDTSV